MTHTIITTDLIGVNEVIGDSEEEEYDNSCRVCGQPVTPYYPGETPIHQDCMWEIVDHMRENNLTQYELIM